MASSSLSHLDASPAFSRMLSAAACSLSVLRLLHLGAEEGPARRGLSRLLRTEPPCWWSEPLVRSGCTSAACSRPRRAASSRRWPSPTTTRRARRPRPRCCSPPRVVHAGGRARLPGGRTRRAVPCHGPSCCRAAGALLFAPRARPCRLERLPLLGLSRAARPRRARRRCWRALPFPPLCAVPSRAICCRAAWQPCAAFAACTAWVHWFAWRAVPATSVPAHLPRPPPRRACAAYRRGRGRCRRRCACAHRRSRRRFRCRSTWGRCRLPSRNPPPLSHGEVADAAHRRCRRRRAGSRCCACPLLVSTSCLREAAASVLSQCLCYCHGAVPTLVPLPTYGRAYTVPFGVPSAMRGRWAPGALPSPFSRCESRRSPDPVRRSVAISRTSSADGCASSASSMAAAPSAREERGVVREIWDARSEPLSSSSVWLPVSWILSDQS